MKPGKKENEANDRVNESNLRQTAEKRLTEDVGVPPTDANALHHELLVHQAELEVQNEELRRSEEQSQQSRDRYENLFEFAPVAHFHSGPVAQDRRSEPSRTHTAQCAKTVGC